MAAVSLQSHVFKQVAWRHCEYCSNTKRFKNPENFIRHLREKHCTIEGGSFICRYGYNQVCSSLPVEGVSDQDYDQHIEKFHVNQSLKEIEQKWTIFSAAQNLPAVLNDPSRGRQSNLFTKKWGDSFTEKTTVPHTPYLLKIEWEHFDPYCKKIGKRFRRHSKLGTVNLQSETPLSGLSPSSSTSSLQHFNGSSHYNNSSNNNNTRSYHEQMLHDSTVRDIPQIFLKPNLDLSQASAFAVVFTGLDCSNSSNNGHKDIQEKLSHYLDIVEVQIAKQVSQKSSSFFHAMTSQDTIMEEMEKAVTNVRKLREKIRHIDGTLVKQSLHIISSERTKTNKTVVLEKLRLMATVHQTQPMIQVLLGTQDYVAALDLISTTQEILAQELNGIHCFRHLPLQLKEMEKLIDKMLNTDFEKFSTADLNRPLLELDSRVLDEDKLVCIISGLLRKKNLNFIDSYKDEAITTIRALIKQLVIEVIASGDNEICLTGSGEEAQSLTLNEWIQLLDSATVSLLKLLKRIRLTHDVMLHVAHSSAGKFSEQVNYLESDAFLSLADHNHIENKLTHLLQSVCNYCHERCANLVSNKSLEQYSGTMDEVEKLTHIVEEFCVGCEEVVGIKSVPLMTALKAQATRFAQNFHSERKSKLSLILDNERWKQAEVPAEFQKIIDHITKSNFLWTKIDDGIRVSPTPVLLVEDEPFALVGSALILVQIVSEYCRCASHLPVIAVQLSRHVIDLLRTFNSRCCQLVLGAGAVHVAGLKMITISNLALVSRALQLVLWLLPHLKVHFQQFEQNGNSSNNSMLSGYLTVEKDFVSHVKELENKMLSIVGQLVHQQLGNWDARPPVPSQSFRNISRHFVKLHEAIAPILPQQQIHEVYRTVHKCFKDKLREQLLKYNIINNGGPQHGTVISELTFYLETLRTLKAMPSEELLDETIDDIWMK